MVETTRTTDPRVISFLSEYLTVDGIGNRQCCFVPDKGVAVIYKKGWLISEYKHFFVVPEFRGQNVGQMILQAVLEHTTTPLLIASVRCDNPRCIHINRKYGFQEIGEVVSPQGNPVKIFLKKIEEKK